MAEQAIASSFAVPTKTVPTRGHPARPLSTAVDRWAGIGPYYAMFPVPFAFEVVRKFAPEGGRVLDPFAGRATSIYAAAASGREGLGIEINRVGWVYGRAKLAPALVEEVTDRLHQVGDIAKTIDQRDLEELPPFFRACYTDDVLRFLLAARTHLEWQKSRSDATLMAHLLIYLHGKLPSCLSNQMPQGKAMAPDYAIRWWRARATRPPEVDPVKFLEQRISWRYKKGIPELATSQVLLGDATLLLPEIAAKVEAGVEEPFSLLFTSPPYFGVVTYHADQWLRGWLLGSEARPVRNGGKWQSRFDNSDEYRQLLTTTWRHSARALRPDAVVYVRTDARHLTFKKTLETLHVAFPDKLITVIARPVLYQTQTSVLGDRTPKPGDTDLVLTPR